MKPTAIIHASLARAYPDDSNTLESSLVQSRELLYRNSENGETIHLR